jgi:hypothetical protein
MNFDISSKLLEKMWDTIVDKGFSALLRPWQMKRENKARLECFREEKLETIKINNEAKQLQISLDKEQFADAEIVPQIEQIASETMNSKIREIVKEEISIAKAVEYAGECIQNENLVDEKPSEMPSEDWLNKWKKRVQEFTDEDALRLWGKVLAGEFASPGRFSYKFLDWMSNITPSEAQLISKLMKNVIGDFYYRGENTDEKMPLTYDELLALQEMDVVQGAESIGMGMSYTTARTDSFEKVLLCANNKKMLLVKNIDSSKELTINGVCTLTRIGKEVKKLCDDETNMKMLQMLGERILKLGFEVYYADVLSVENGLIHYSRNLTKIEANGAAV